MFSRLSGCEGTRGKIGVARIECSNTQRQKHCEEEGDHGKRPIAASHGSTPLKAKRTGAMLVRQDRLAVSISGVMFVILIFCVPPMKTSPCRYQSSQETYFVSRAMI